jgi:ppGpp synthetase/RelA/SpoT-type nucleotidyltranferase
MDDLRALCQARYEARVPALDALAATLEGETRQAVDGLHHIDRIAFRTKGVTSFVDKACEAGRYAKPLVEIEDQVAGRVIVFFLPDLDDVESRLRETFNPVEHTVKRPKYDDAFGYESRHLVCMIPPHLVPAGWDAIEDAPTTFELQLRTVFMHAYAEPQHNIGYKSPEDVPREVKRQLAWIAASSWGADQAYKRLIEDIEAARAPADDEV